MFQRKSGISLGCFHFFYSHSSAKGAARRFRSGNAIGMAATALVAVFLLTAGSIQAAQINAGSLNFQINRHTGVYRLQSHTPAMTFQGSVGGPVSAVKTASGKDRIGAYKRIAFQWKQKGVALRASVRLYLHKPVTLFSLQFLGSVEHPQIAFPDFRSESHPMHVFSYNNDCFAPPQFKAGQSDTPWLLFDDHFNAAVISPAGHFLVTTMRGNGTTQIAVALHPKIPVVPANYQIRSLMVMTHGINAAWNLWGHALTSLTGKTRPSNVADVALSSLGYWTDNGCGYFFHTHPKWSYSHTILNEIKYLHHQNIPVRYLQLDGWWLVRHFNTEDVKKIVVGKKGYKPNPTFFPKGLKAFQKELGLPLVVWWADVGSALGQKLQDWDHFAAYLESRGTVTFEHDFLCTRYSVAHFGRHLNRGDEFFGNMAKGMAAHHLTVQYCMPLPSEYMESSKYSNVATIRVSDDFFIHLRWREFLFNSRLARSVGLWPWADACMSTSRYGLLLQTLSGGMVGFGDLRGQQDQAHIMPAVRADGVIVKPDVPLVPTGRSYLNAIKHPRRPIIARTHTQQNSVRTVYVFAFDGADAARVPFHRSSIKPGLVSQGYMPNRWSCYYVSKQPYSKVIAGYHRTVRFSPDRMGLQGAVYVYNYFTHQIVKVPSGGRFVGRLGKQQASFYVCAATTPSGIAFLGDLHNYVGTGKARIPYLANRSGELLATVAFAKGEKTITLSGVAAYKPVVQVHGGSADTLHYSPASGLFSVVIKPGVGAKHALLVGQPVKEVKVVFSKP